ncbi:serine/arginine repetitive matrix protein 2 isoform X4 [Anastrepha ludens]|uniref:serine/arginine repetitive matrix protein 2 isoform X4 n=1 Tax=Anastrepha ludens TaxID=28586 RepID=UPI0023B1A6E3|nr:serine/arginine repetitive matrix protein 2 isoform X4 [Anastrepha ludens]
MYNGIGLTTPRGSGTNGHVQRNWAFVRPGKKDNSNYRSEEDIKKLDATLNRPPNKEILDHDRKRKIEVKCIEFEEILEKQGRTPEEIKTKVDSYRQKLMGLGKSDLPKDEFGRIAVRETHQIAEAQQEKNAKLREAFNISEYFVEGSSFDSDRKAKEDIAKSLALQKELDSQRESAASSRDKEKEHGDKRRYALVRSPSREKDNAVSGGNKDDSDNEAYEQHVSKSEKKKKKKRTRESSASPERKRDKKKKSKKHKKERQTNYADFIISKSKKKKSRKRKSSESDSGDSDHASENEKPSSDSEYELKKQQRKRTKKDKKKRDKKKKKERTRALDKSRSRSPDRFVKDDRKRTEERSSRRGDHNSARSPSKSATRKSLDRRSSERLGREDRRRRDERSKQNDNHSPRNASKSSARNPFRSRSRERETHRRSPQTSHRRNTSTESRSREYSRERNRGDERDRHDKSVERRREISADRNARRRKRPRSISRDRRGGASLSRQANASRTRSRSRSKSVCRNNRRRSPSSTFVDNLRKRTITPTVPPRKGVAASVSPTRSDSSTRKNPFNPFKVDVPPLAGSGSISEVRPGSNPFKNSVDTAKPVKMSSRTRSPSAASSSLSRAGKGRSRSKKEDITRISRGKSPLNERSSSVRSSRSNRDDGVKKNEKQYNRERSRECKMSPVQRRSAHRAESEFRKEQSRERKTAKARQRSGSRSMRNSKQRELSHAHEKSSLSRRSTSRADREVEKRRKVSRERSSELRLGREITERERSRERRVMRDNRSERRRSREQHVDSARASSQKLSPARRRRSHSPLAATGNKGAASPTRSPTRKRSRNVASPPSKIREEIEAAPLRRSPSRNSSELSYSPAQRNPERYRDILEAKEKGKGKEKPVIVEHESKKRNAEVEALPHDAHKVRNVPEESATNDPENRERSGRIKERATSNSSHTQAMERDRDLDRDSQRDADRNGRPRSKEKRTREHKRETRDACSTKRAKPISGPVVRLQGQSEDENDADDRTEKVSASLDEFQETRRGRELKDLQMLEQLKTDIAAKAKEKLKSIEKMNTGQGGSIGSEVSEKNNNEQQRYRRGGIRNSLNEFLAANNVAGGVVGVAVNTNRNNNSNHNPKSNSNNISSSTNNNHSVAKSREDVSNVDTTPPMAAIYPQPLDVQMANDVLSQSEIANDLKIETEKEKNKTKAQTLEQCKDTTQTDCKDPSAANGLAAKSPTLPSRDNPNTNARNAATTISRQQMPLRRGARRSTPPQLILHPRKSHHRVKINTPSGGVSLINAPLSSGPSSNYMHYGGSTNPANAAAGSFMRQSLSRVNHHHHHNNPPLIPHAPHAFNPLLSKHFNSGINSLNNNTMLISRREHHHRCSIGLNTSVNAQFSSTNFSNNSLLLTPNNSHHAHHHHSHQHQHGSNASIITDQFLIAASLATVTGGGSGGGHHARVHHHELGLSAAQHHGYNSAAVAAASNLSYHHHHHHHQHSNKPKIIIKPFKINDPQPLVAALADSTLVDTIVSKVSTATVAAAESAARRSRSRSRRSRSRSRSRPRREAGGAGGTNRRHSTSRSRSSHYSSSSSRSHSRTRSHSHRSSRSRSHSHSSHSSCSTRSSSRSSSSSGSSGSSRTGSRSPSIPRRRGSPSFLDRRRITSARKRPIPYHRKTPSDASSYCSSCYSRESSPHSPSRSPTRSSHSPSTAF